VTLNVSNLAGTSPTSPTSVAAFASTRAARKPKCPGRLLVRYDALAPLGTRNARSCGRRDITTHLTLGASHHGERSYYLPHAMGRSF